MGEFEAANGKALPEAVIKKWELPRMFASEAEVVAIEDTASSATTASAAASTASIIESFAL